MSARKLIPDQMEYPSFLVSPLHDTDEALRKGHYDGNPPFITNETVSLKLVGHGERKQVYVVPLQRRLGQDEYAAYLTTKGFVPCVKAPNYLAGLMAKVSEIHMPPELRDKCLVAAEPNKPTSVFQDKERQKCFLCVHRYGLYRIPGLVGISGDWNTQYALLAELAPKA